MSDRGITAKKINGRQSGQPTISDVARVANCSPMTVSRVINNEASVREQTRAAVLEAIAQLNYKPNRAARSLAGAAQMRSCPPERGRSPEVSVLPVAAGRGSKPHSRRRRN